MTVDCGAWKPRTDGKPSLHQPLRRYVYDSARVPFNAFNDLQSHEDVVEPKKDRVTVRLPAKSMTFLTTDYVDAVPAPVTGVRVVDGRLVWDAAESPDHRYYRVYRDGRQIASTVATSFRVGDAKGGYAVRSVDRWLNVGR